jgi:hypothetical protein
MKEIGKTTDIDCLFELLQQANGLAARITYAEKSVA